MTNLEKHLELLGMKVTDRVSGLSGVVTSISFDLYGCIQAVVHPGVDEQGKIRESNWFDVARLEINSGPVMERPDFGLIKIAMGGKGPADKPSFMKS